MDLTLNFNILTVFSLTVITGDFLQVYDFLIFTWQFDGDL